jgi:CheY-like chemotaxis protein
VHADPGQVEQVIMNLIVNARDAIAGNGTIEVATGRVELADDNPAGARPGAYATFTVKDSGAGIPAHVRPHLFEPFFTTKVLGEGTGLGLATSYGIITQAGGFITVDSEVGRGATFVVHLPEVTAHGDVVAEVARPPAVASGELALVVEDEDAVRSVTAGILQAAGFTVLEARDGVDALARAEGQPVRVLVADMVMPRMNGLELARRLREDRPDLGVLFVSGYPGDHQLLNTLPPRTVFIQKPFRSVELTERVHALL